MSPNPGEKFYELYGAPFIEPPPAEERKMGGEGSCKPRQGLCRRPGGQLPLIEKINDLGDDLLVWISSEVSYGSWIAA